MVLVIEHRALSILDKHSTLCCILKEDGSFPHSGTCYVELGCSMSYTRGTYKEADLGWLKALALEWVE